MTDVHGLHRALPCCTEQRHTGVRAITFSYLAAAWVELEATPADSYATCIDLTVKCLEVFSRHSLITSLKVCAVLSECVCSVFIIFISVIRLINDLFPYFERRCCAGV